MLNTNEVSEVLYRVAKFEVKPSQAQLKVMLKMSDSCKAVWNIGQEWQAKAFEVNLKNYYNALKAEAKKGKDADQATISSLKRQIKSFWDGVKSIRKEMMPFQDRLRSLRADRATANKSKDSAKVEFLDRQIAEVVSEVENGPYQKLKNFCEGTYFPERNDLINSLTQLRSESQDLTNLPRNWQEQTLIMLAGDYDSFMVLRGNGDYDAKPPGQRKENAFVEISGRAGWSIKDGALTLSCPKLSHGVEMSFPIPQKQQEWIARGKVKEFKIYRDETDMSRPGKFWISLSYEMPMPDRKTFDPAEAVYVALGASSIGIVSPRGGEVVELGRPDFHWIPQIRKLEEWRKVNEGVERNGQRVMIEGKGKLPEPSVCKSTGRLFGFHPKIEGSRSKPWEGDERVSRRFRPRKRNSRSDARVQMFRREMFRIMAAQAQLDRREVVAQDLLENIVMNKVYGHGVHFVVTDLVVRSKKGKLADGKDKSRGGDLGANWAAQNTGSIAYLVAWLTEKAKEHGGTVRKHKLPSGQVPQGAGKGHENKIAMAQALRNSFLPKQQS